MTESQSHHRFALSPHVTPGRVLAAALVTAALTPAAASAKPADAGPANPTTHVVAGGPRPSVVLTGIAAVQHRPDGLAGAPQSRGHDTSSLGAAPRPQVAATQDLRAPDQTAPGSVVQDQRAPDQVAPAPTPVATTDDGGLEPGWIVLIAGAGVLLAAGIGLAGRRTRHTRELRRGSVA
jgi:hypothetical protein